MALLIAKIAVGLPENPRVISEKQMHPQRDPVWCGFWAGGIIGPYFFENEAGQVATVNGAQYRDTITQFFRRNWMILMWPICGFNKTMPHTI